jgi:hypothetical protein
VAKKFVPMASTGLFMDDEFEVLYSKRLITRASYIYWRKWFFSKRIIILPVIVSICYVATWGCTLNGKRNSIRDLAVGCLVLVLFWMSLGYTYVKMRRLALKGFKPLLGRNAKVVLTDKGITVLSGDYRRELLWSDMDKRLESPEMVLIYSSRRKGFIFFPNAGLSDSIKKRISQMPPEVISSRS